MTEESARALSEFELIARYFRRRVDDPAVLIGSGDDAALVVPDLPVAISTDTLVEGVHFRASIDPGRLAERALAVNLSDMAAMGARPRWFTVALTLPHANAEWLERFAQGLHACAARYAVALIGGDTTRGPLCLSVHIAGEVGADEALRRGGAAGGDAVFVTGTLGDAAAGLGIDASGTLDADAQFLLDRYEIPEPRIAAGIALRGVASAAIDVSDGLLADLGRLCVASEIGARIDVDKLPLSAPLQRRAGLAQARDFALHGGDDYELCFTVPQARLQRLTEAAQQCGVAVTRIGTCHTGTSIDCYVDGRRRDIAARGYEHFR